MPFQKLLIIHCIDLHIITPAAFDNGLQYVIHVMFFHVQIRYSQMC